MQLSELRTRVNRLVPTKLHDDGEENLVTDQRASLSPAQVVEQKFRNVLHRGVSFFSQVTCVQKT